MGERERTLVVLLSTHRCGSSLTAHILARLGMSLGPFELNPAAPSNPYGHFEAIPFLNLNRQIQNRAYGFSEDLPESREILARFVETKGAWDEGMDIPGELLAEGRSLIRALLDSGRISGFKDPRTVLTWPFWKRVLADFPDVRVIPLGLVRSPHEIAMSVVTRQEGWCGYWTTLDVIAVSLRRLKLILDSSDDCPPTICFGSETYLKTVEMAVLHCGLIWSSATVLNLFDPSSVHQRQAAVVHEAHEFFEALCDGETGHRDRDSDHAQHERDARFIEELQLERWRSHQLEIAEVREEARRMSLRLSEVEHQYRELEHRHREVEPRLTWTENRVAEAERARNELSSQLIDAERRLNWVQEREIVAWHRNEQLRNRLERFESHPLLGPMLRGRRRIRRMIGSRPTVLAPNGLEPNQGDARH
jgi:hypothetical protein